MKLFKEKDLSFAVELLKKGGTLVFPTETSYGLGCDAANQDAVDKIFMIKGRNSNKPLLVVVPSVEMAKEYLEWDELIEKLTKKFWPGALTIVAKSKVESRKSDVANGVVSKENTLAIRVTNHPVGKYLSENLGRPVVATSANIADAGDAYDPEEIIKMFAGRELQPDAIVDGGILPVRKPSTVVSVVGREFKVLRQGEVKIR